MYRIILASESPRRKEIMDQMGIAYETMPANVAEEASGDGPSDMVKALAKLKARNVNIQTKKLQSGEEGLIVIGADTVVYHNGKILGKPKDREDAVKMLEALSGDIHEVYTGVCIIISRNKQEHGDNVKDEEIVFSVSTKVAVNPLTREQIEDYVDTKEPFDKAGAYAIQGGFGIYIKEIHGDYYNVVGFPIARIYEELLAHGINIKK
ncbi:MAG TPA: septum formation protein Maf [Clostridiales bacterium]|jgi:septum formation protein|nr:septum formation protein Maf [Clostridiales bacterium]